MKPYMDLKQKANKTKFFFFLIKCLENLVERLEWTKVCKLENYGIVPGREAGVELGWWLW